MNIILCGFMGAGKTRIGKEISKLTGREFIDTDDIAEEIAGKRIADIFAQSGEQEFRKIETEACIRAAEHDNAVISTGGGAVTFERNTEILKGSGIIIFIDASFAESEAATPPLGRFLRTNPMPKSSITKEKANMKKPVTLPLTAMANRKQLQTK